MQDSNQARTMMAQAMQDSGIAYRPQPPPGEEGLHRQRRQGIGEALPHQGPRQETTGRPRRHVPPGLRQPRPGRSQLSGPSRPGGRAGVLPHNVSPPVPTQLPHPHERRGHPAAALRLLRPPHRGLPGPHLRTGQADRPHPQVWREAPAPPSPGSGPTGTWSAPPEATPPGPSASSGPSTPPPTS